MNHGSLQCGDLGNVQWESSFGTRCSDLYGLSNNGPRTPHKLQMKESVDVVEGSISFQKLIELHRYLNRDG